MNLGKRMIAVMLTAMMLVSGAWLPTVKAEAAVSFTLETVEHIGAVKAGDTFTVTVTVSPMEAVSSMSMSFYYDADRMEAVSGVAEGFLATDFMKSTVNLTPVNDSGEVVKGMITLGGVNTSNVAVKAETVIATVTFRALNDIRSDAVFAFAETSAARDITTRMECAAVDGKLDIIRGDINDDHALTLRDVTTVFYTVNGRTSLTQAQLEMADVNEDGAVTLSDAVGLFYTVSGLK